MKFKVTVSRDCHLYADLTIDAKNKREAEIEGMKLLQEGKVTLKQGYVIEHTDRVSSKSEILSRCPKCDSTVGVPYEPDSMIDCPCCNKKIKTLSDGSIDWNYTKN